MLLAFVYKTSHVIALATDPSTLKNVVKVLFRLSKDSANDGLFQREGLIVPMLDAIDPGEHDMHDNTHLATNGLVYAAGTLKNISVDAKNQTVLIDAGVLAVLMRLLEKRCTNLPTNPGAPAGTSSRPGSATSRPWSASTRTAMDDDEAAQLAVQLTGTLRNIAVMSSHADLFHQTRIVPVLAALVARCEINETLNPKP